MLDCGKVPPETWRKALIRAEAFGLEVKFSHRPGNAGRFTYHVTSASRPGHVHGVTVDLTTDEIMAACSCEAGQNERVCKHVAAVLHHQGQDYFFDPSTSSWKETDAQPEAVVISMEAE